MRNIAKSVVQTKRVVFQVGFIFLATLFVHWGYQRKPSGGPPPTECVLNHIVDAKWIDHDSEKQLSAHGDTIEIWTIGHKGESAYHKELMHKRHLRRGCEFVCADPPVTWTVWRDENGLHVAKSLERSTLPLEYNFTSQVPVLHREGRHREGHHRSGRSLANLTTDEILAAARDGETAAIRESAIWKLPLGTYDAALAEIAKTNPYGRVRAAAVDKCTDAAALAEIALHEPESWIQVKAIEKVTDKSALETSAKSGNGLVRPAAEKRIAALKR